MLKKLLFLLFATCISLSADDEDITGFWKSVNDETGKPQCIIAVYEHDDVYYGRIIATFDSEGKLSDTIYDPKGRAPGLVGSPFYAGLDIIWNLQKSGAVYKGKIVDPQKGNVYNAELWRQNDDLIVRGKLLFLGRNQTWFKVLPSDLPKEFKLPNVTKFSPAIPQVK